MFEPKLIATPEEHKQALRYLNELLEKDDEGTLSPQEGNILDLLAYLIGKYEKEHFPLSLPDPVEAIRFRMEQYGMSPDDLVPYIGSRSKVSEVLNKKRPLSIKMIRDLHRGLGISYEVLVQNNDDAVSPNNTEIDWTLFPYKIMYQESNRKFYFPNIKVSYDEFKENLQMYLEPLISPVSDIAFNYNMRRQHVRMGSSSDEYAVAAWIAACCQMARQDEASQTYNSNRKTEIVAAVKAISLLDEGPSLVQKLLKKYGIHYCVIPHLPKTHLDGVSCIGSDGNPVIGMTIRYDRLDNFWYTLFHELAHVFLHLSSDKESHAYIDDLQYRANNEQEQEADDFAGKELIDDSLLDAYNLFADYSAERVLAFANKHAIHPSIVAGRIRYKLNNYRILWNLVGNGEVRKYLIN